MRDDFAVFILSNGRPDNIKTLRALKIQIQPMLRLNKWALWLANPLDRIQIQPMLRLN